MGEIYLMEIINVFTDGSWHNLDKHMGIGIYINYRGKVIRYGKYIGLGTNNIAELTAIKTALLKLKQYKSCTILIHTDSKYCIGVLSKNWKIKANQALITSIYRLMTLYHKVQFKWVKGHDSSKGNNEADKLAINCRKNQSSINETFDIPVTGQISDNFVSKTKIYTPEEIDKINQNNLRKS